MTMSGKLLIVEKWQYELHLNDNFWVAYILFLFEVPFLFVQLTSSELQ